MNHSIHSHAPIQPAARTWSRSTLPVLAFVSCGVWMIGLGLYFALLRPSLLPEDLRFMGATLAQIHTALPGLARWLTHVFVVMGGFMAACGVLTIFLAVKAVPMRLKGTGPTFLMAGTASVLTMSWTNFAIESDFKWLLLVPALLWLGGVAAYVLDVARLRQIKRLHGAQA
jgi:hypothetical protein